MTHWRCISSWTPFIALFVVHAIFAGWNILGRAVLAPTSSSAVPVSPVIFSLVREVISSIILISVASTCNSGSVIPKPKDRWNVVLLGTCGTFLNQIGFIYGLKYTNAMTAGVFQPLLPVCTTLFAYLLRDKTEVITGSTLGKFIGLMLSVCGALMIVLYSGLAHHEDSTNLKESLMMYFFGLFMLSVNIVAFSYSLILQKRLLNVYSSKWVTAWSYTVGCMEMMVAAVFIDGPDHLIGIFTGEAKGIFSGKVLSVLVYVILFTTVLNYSLLSWANKETSSETVAVFFSVNPFITAILANIFLDEKLSIFHVLGGIMILLGLLKFRSASMSDANRKSIATATGEFDYERVSLSMGHDEDVEDELTELELEELTAF